MGMLSVYLYQSKNVHAIISVNDDQLHFFHYV